MTPAEVEAAPEPTTSDRLRLVWRRYRWFTIFVILPVALAAFYLYLFASDQYVSEAHYLVRTQSGSTPPSTGGSFASLFSGGGATGSAAGMAAAGESMSVSDYLTSHDVVDALQKQLNIVALFRRPEADALSRLPVANPTPEFLLRYYRRQVDVYYDTDTGITTLKARAFRPEDAYAIASALLALGERRVNEMNIRGYTDAVALSRRQLEEAERALRSVQAQVTAFRQRERDANPTGSADAQIALVSRLQGELSSARAQLATTLQLIGSANPQAEALRQQVRSLEAQVAANTSRLAGGTDAIAAGLGNYEALQLQQQFLAQRYAAASAAFESARQNAVRQQLYVTRVVNANRPVKSTYPQRGTMLLTLFVALVVIYALGWLISAGVREHSV